LAQALEVARELDRFGHEVVLRGCDEILRRLCSFHGAARSFHVFGVASEHARNRAGTVEVFSEFRTANIESGSRCRNAR
jgi:hypothetical protein